MLRVVSRSTLVASLSALGLVACDAPPPRETTATEASPPGEAVTPIIDGSPDTEHPAVVWLFDADAGASCSGTIIAVDGSTGYVLTAAHCAGMDRVAITTDYRSCFGPNVGPDCQGLFEVDEQIYHPDWTGDVSTPDFSLIRFVGAGPSTPVIPAAPSDDGVVPGATIEIVGFGQTESGDNSLRNHKVTQVGRLIGAPPVFTHPSTVCFGDSGGPALLGGRVVGVSSYVDSDSCRGDGYSARVESVYDELIAPYLAQDPIVLGCDRCLEVAATTIGGPCGDELRACATSPGCAAIDDCIAGCAGNPGCENQCGLGDPEAYALHDAVVRCTYCDQCVTECGGEDARCSLPSPTVTVGATATVGVGGVGGAGGAGGGEGDGGAASDGGAGDDDGGCAVGASGPRPASSRAGWGFALAALGAGLLRRRRDSVGRGRVG